MKEFETINICDGVNVVYAETDKFKTNEIAVTFLTPLTEKQASANALLSGLLSRTTKKYPSISALNKKLALLYGARVTSYVNKLGENQSTTIMLSSLADRFAIDGESIGAESFSLLMDMVFEPNIAGGAFANRT